MRKLAMSVAVAVICALGAACGTVTSETPDASPGTPDGSGSLGNGTACTAGDQCQTGACVDGVCCTTACEGQCEACDVAGAVGTCTPVTGAPHGTRSACTGDGTVCGGACDGVNADACAYPTVECRAASCTDGTQTAAATCEQGTCPAAVTEACAVTCGATSCVTATQVAAGYYNSCALMSDETVRCWGDNSAGQNGVDDYSGVPLLVPGLTGVKQITTANAHTCALLGDGTARCWGSNSFGELGIGVADTMMRNTPQVVKNETNSGPLTGIQAIVAGQFRTCAIVTVGTGREARCWGWNAAGAVGNGSTDVNARFPLPQPVCSSGSVAGGNCTRSTTVSEIATGREHTCARFQSGALGCWGSNIAGQLGFTIDNVAHPNPIFVRSNGANLIVDTFATAVGETGHTTCAVRRSDKVVLCWGRNAQGQLGRGNFTNPLTGQEIPSPVCRAVDGCPTLTATALGAGFRHACAISLDKARCWGGNNRGQVGDSSDTDKSVSASDVATAANVRQLAVGEFHTCALLVDGRVQCWGIGSGIGNDATDDVLAPAFPTW
jgi:alpha-tubulin suppressor-like RCC1 family protein